MKQFLEGEMENRVMCKTKCQGKSQNVHGNIIALMDLTGITESKFVLYNVFLGAGFSSHDFGEKIKLSTGHRFH